MAIVVDASALVLALIGSPPVAAPLLRRVAAEECHAPHLIDAEVGNVLRRRVMHGHLSEADALVLLDAASPLIDHRYAMTGALAQGAWRLHRNLSFYDALYAALATALSITLITADARLRRAPGLGCVVEAV